MTGVTGVTGDVPLTTVLLATRNGAVHLEAQLQSLGAQDAPWRLFVSDDGSWDDTRLILSRFADAHPEREVRVVEGPRQRLAGANFLHGLRHPALFEGVAPGPVAFCDQDDVWHPHRLSDAAGLLAGAEGPALACAPIQPVTADAGAPQGGVRAVPARSFANALVQNVLPGPSITLNAAAVAALRADPAPPAPLPFHDWWVYLRATAAGWPIHVAGRVALDYRQHGGNVVGQGGSLAKLARLWDGSWTQWRDGLLDALLALPEDTIMPEARAAAQVLRHGHPRRRAWAQSKAHRASAAQTRLFRILAFVGRV